MHLQGTQGVKVDSEQGGLLYNIQLKCLHHKDTSSLLSSRLARVMVKETENSTSSASSDQGWVVWRIPEEAMLAGPRTQFRGPQMAYDEPWNENMTVLGSWVGSTVGAGLASVQGHNDISPWGEDAANMPLPRSHGDVIRSAAVSD
jgi:hypothetical protein